jgi:hypothetical protein
VDQSREEIPMFEGTVQEQVIARALKDPVFRQALLSNPRAVLEQEYQIHLAEEVTIRVLEEPPNTFTLVVPAREEALLELSDADLEDVSGGACPTSSPILLGR